MKAKQRTAVSGIIMALANNGQIKNVYSYELATHISLSGTAENNHVKFMTILVPATSRGTAIMANNIACTTTGLFVISA